MKSTLKKDRESSELGYGRDDKSGAEGQQEICSLSEIRLSQQQQGGPDKGGQTSHGKQTQYRNSPAAGNRQRHNYRRGPAVIRSEGAEHCIMGDWQPGQASSSRQGHLATRGGHSAMRTLGPYPKRVRGSWQIVWQWGNKRDTQG